MSRWTENKEWKDFQRWLMTALAAFYVAFTLVFIFILARPMAQTVVQQVGCTWAESLITCILQLGAVGNLIAVVWACMSYIRHKPGDWPN